MRAELIMNLIRIASKTFSTALFRRHREKKIFEMMGKKPGECTVDVS
jgi:hypothetical protein